MAKDTSRANPAVNKQQTNHPSAIGSIIDEPMDSATQAALEAFIREHPHLKEASAEWQLFYYRIRAAVLAER